MKNRLCLASLLLALSALGYSSWLHWSSERRADAAVAHALRQKEIELVEWLKPDFLKMCEEMGLEAYPKDPQSLLEMIEAMTDLVKKL